MDAKVSIKAKTKTKPVQTLFRYISFKALTKYERPKMTNVILMTKKET